MGGVDGGGIAGKFWIKFKNVSVFALYTPFFVSLAAGTLHSDAFCHCVSQDVHILKTFSHCCELAEDCADDDDDKAGIRKLGMRVKQKLKTFDSLVRDWDFELPEESIINNATVKYTDFLLATASDQTKYWFQEAALQTEELLDKLSISLTGEELEIIEKLYHQAMKHEVDFYTAPPLVQKTVVPLSRVNNPVEGQLTIFCDFDLTCTAFDSSAILAEIAIVTAPKADPDQSEMRLARMSSADLRNAWHVLSTKYTEEYEQCIENIMPSEAVRKFDYEGLLEALKQLAVFEKKANSRVVESGVLKGLNLEDITRTGQSLLLQDGCRAFFQEIVKSENLRTDVHVLSYCWCGDLIRSAFSLAGRERDELQSI